MDEVSLVSLMTVILGSGPSIFCRDCRLEIFVTGLVSSSFHFKPYLVRGDGQFRLHVPPLLGIFASVDFMVFPLH